MSALRTADWLDALEAEFASLAAAALGVQRVAPLSRHAAPPPGMGGAYLALVSPQGAYQIGLAAPPAGCEAFARGLLSLGPAEPLAAADVADAVCEIVNMLAGGVQRRIRAKSGDQLGLGLPTFFNGTPQPTERLCVAVAEVRAGAIPAALLVLHPKQLGAQEGER
jgi:hypothetical protein